MLTIACRRYALVVFVHSPYFYNQFYSYKWILLMNINDPLHNQFKAQKPHYIALAKQSVDSDFMVTVGVGWKVMDSESIILRLDLLPTKWDGIVLLTRSQ
jgi:hypothetical protein